MPERLQPCPHCHQEHPPGAQTCPVTGQPLICPTCGHSLTSRSDECSNCGAILPRPVAQVAPVAPPVEAPPAQAEPLPQEVEAEFEVPPAVEVQPVPSPVLPKRVTGHTKRKPKATSPVLLEPTAEEKPVQLCPSCGKANLPDAIYCAYCASRLKEALPEVKLPEIPKKPTDVPKKVVEAPKEIAKIPKEITLRFSFWPITVDFASRWLLWYFWQRDVVADWVFWVGQILVISVGILVWASSRYNKIREDAGYSTTDFNVSPQITTWSVLFSLSVVGWGIYSAVSLSASWFSWLRVAWAILIFFLYGVYILILYLYSVAAPRPIPKLKGRYWKQSYSWFMGILIVGVVVCFFVLLFASTPSGGEGQIVFVSDRDGNEEIYMMNADGSEVIRLTNNSAEDSVPAGSPDGKRIAFVSRRDGNGEIYVMNADGSGQTNITNNPAWDGSPAWSPDGQKIVFVSDRDGVGDIYTINANGGKVTRLTYNSALYRTPAWSPDGRKITFVADSGGEIYVMNADGGGQTNLTNNPAYDWFPAWSPDGKRIAFVSERDGGGGIYVMNANGGGVVRLTNNNTSTYYWSLTWSPDGKKIAFMSYQDGNPEIYVMNANGSGKTNLTNSPANDQDPAWLPNPAVSPDVAGVLTATSVPALGIGSTWTRPADGMVMMYVPAGNFTMGSDHGNPDEQPVHSVYLDAYLIDQTEVTNAMFQKFVQATGYETDANKAGYSWVYDGSRWNQVNGANWNHPRGPDTGIDGLGNHPVTHVSWNDANSYCQWAGGPSTSSGEVRLPTEAEWEKAARGGLEGMFYPWGDQSPTCTTGVTNGAQYASCGGETVAVGTFGPNGYGLYDMAGNAGELVAGWYDVYPGGDPNSSDLFGQMCNVLRGGSWSTSHHFMRSSFRYACPMSPGADTGFRCVRSLSMSEATTPNAAAIPSATYTPTSTLTLTPTISNTPTKTTTPSRTPLPSLVHRQEYKVIVRYLSGVDSTRIGLLISRLESLGYNVVSEPYSAMANWDFPQSAFLYGNPSCLEAIEDIRLQTQEIANLSTLPVYRFKSDDVSYNIQNIVIQLIDKSYFP